MRDTFDDLYYKVTISTFLMSVVELHMLWGWWTVCDVDHYFSPISHAAHCMLGFGLCILMFCEVNRLPYDQRILLIADARCPEHGAAVSRALLDDPSRAIFCWANFHVSVHTACY